MVTPQVNDKLCSRCGNEELRFLHLVWYEDKIQSLCTSCVLLTHRQSFCPTCFAFHDFNSQGVFIRCAKCLSFSHPSCFSSSNSSSCGPLVCSSCINPNRLASALGDDGNLKDSADLLLTAARIATLSISKAFEASKTCAQMLAAKAASAKKKAIAAVIRVADRENKRHDGPSLLHFSTSSDEEDTATETDEDIAAEADNDIQEHHVN